MCNETAFSVNVTLFDMPEEIILRMFRLSGNAVVTLLKELGHDLEPEPEWSHAISAATGLHAKLQYAASGSLHRTAANAASREPPFPGK